MITEAIIRCPECGFKKTEGMPIGFPQTEFTCPKCLKKIAASGADCCVFCKYSDQHCPAMQEKRNCCSG